MTFRPTRLRSRVASLLLGGAALTACSGDSPSDPGEQPPPVPMPGMLAISASNAAATDGAYMLAIPRLTDASAVVAARSDLQLFVRSGTNGLRVAVFGPIASGPLVRFAVADVADSLSYAPTLLDAAATDGTARTNAERAAVTFRVSRTP